MTFHRLLWRGLLAAVLFSIASQTPRTPQAANHSGGAFRRIAMFDVNGRVAEIVSATADGRTLIYTNSADRKLGFVDISNPAAPVESEALDAGGEPTSVATTPDGKWALAVLDATPAKLLVIDLSDRTIETTLTLGGQPDSIAVSRDGRYAAIVIENERDESVNGGRMPQTPAGFLTIVDLVGQPGEWTLRNVSLTDLAARFPTDPEPEYVSINSANEAAVTLQENNHVVIVNLADGSIVSHWTAGVTTHPADTRNDNNIAFAGSINGRREPDAVVWTPGGRLLTANEGDYTVDLTAGEFAGGRDFTIFSSSGGVIYEPGVELELIAARHGHYPDARSGSKGVEMEGAEVGVYHGSPFAFIGSERGDFIAVYDLTDETTPRFVQLLPTGDAPEGLLAIPQRNLFVVASEGDGSLTLYEFTTNARQLNYPNVVSETEFWGALSGLALAPNGRYVAVSDSAFRPGRIYTIAPGHPAKIEGTLTLAKNPDLEGIAIRPEGGYWLVSEGGGNAPNATSKNLLIQVNADGTIAREVELPASVNDKQAQFGYEGVAASSDGSQVYVAFQREWADDPRGFVKIGRYTPATGEWAFYHYPLEPAPNASAWVGLSELVRINDTTFAVLERDNQLREAARIKRIYSFSIAGLTPATAGATPPRVTKILLRDLWQQDGFLLEKAEGLALTPQGDWVVVSDNDGAGETRWLTVLNPNFDACVQDDESGDVLRLNRLTGEYQFTRCGTSGFTLTGRAALVRQGCQARFRDSRLLFAVISDCGFRAAPAGAAALRLNPLGPPLLLNDRNLSDNTCLCR
jgi:DNA-binding beta-propeller fold protein YncE